jgi:subtilisin-like proprotein convertase family protein
MSKGRDGMNGGKLGLAVTVLSLGLIVATPAAEAKKKVVTKTYLQGVGSPTGGTALPIPDGGGQLTQLVRSRIDVRGLNPRGKIRHVKVGVRASHVAAKDLEFYLASPRGVINLSSDNGGQGNNYGGSFESCAGQFTLFDSSGTATPINTPGLQAPFAGVFGPEESLGLLSGLGNKKANNAAWTLLVEDDDSANPVGTLWCWKLVISATNPKPK